MGFETVILVVFVGTATTASGAGTEVATETDLGVGFGETETGVLSLERRMAIEWKEAIEKWGGASGEAKKPEKPKQESRK